MYIRYAHKMHLSLKPKSKEFISDSEIGRYLPKC